jgi:alkylation response protein AidB-like acyl-CoA dehydrogenase
MHPLTPDQRSLQLRARELAQGQFAPTAADTDRTEQYPWANVALLRDAGFMGMTLPTRVGGSADPQ